MALSWRWRTTRSLVVACTILLVGMAAPANANPADDRVRKLGDEFLARALARAPQLATRLGVHTMDGDIVPVTQATLAEDAAWLTDFRARLADVPAASLSPDASADYRLLAARTERELLDAEVIRPYERDPSAYLPLLGPAVEWVLLSRGVSICTRLQLAAHRLARAPEVLRAARINLRRRAS
jgi:uncharacterized protein (DUF885 family)